MPRGPHDEEIERDKNPDDNPARERLAEFLRKRLPQGDSEHVEDKSPEDKPGQANEKLKRTTRKR